MNGRSVLGLAVLCLLAVVGCSSDSTAPCGVEPDEAILSTPIEGTGQATGFDEDWIGPSGGRLSIPGAILNVPAGALTTTIHISMERLADGSVELLPHGLVFEQPVELGFILLMGRPASGHEVEWFDPDAGFWRVIPSATNGLGRTAPLEHFSLYRIQSHI